MSRRTWIEKLLGELVEIFAERRATVLARELTKKFEEVFERDAGGVDGIGEESFAEGRVCGFDQRGEM